MAVKILAADDSATMRKVLDMTFAGEPVELLTVGTGEAVLDQATQWQPDLVIADGSMPMDGYDVARALKNNPATSNTAVVVLASQHHPFDASRARDCGVDDHLLKPYDTQLLIDKAREVLSRPRAQAVAGAPVSAPPPRVSRPSSSVGLPAREPSVPRSTVAFGSGDDTQSSQIPRLELAEEEPPSRHRAPTARAMTPPTSRAPSRPSMPAARAPSRPPSRPSRTSMPRATTGTSSSGMPQRKRRPSVPNIPAVPPSVQPPRQESHQAQPTPLASPAAAAPVAAAAAAATGELSGRLEGLGLTKDQIEGVLGLSREVVERVVWEVVPDLAEVIIREEIRRLTSE